ncbi:PLxRFG domain-containing protein [Acinetobacter sp. ANC 5045]|uniref:PLxRFG domain-containing protein n=1 Tax=Acinetobacter sp. ANC 5045 TaxID=2529851 RepID=UPI00103AC466|nr:PLxRFG domain-containing protein [Acinetobacter sp. ANC 5045]TCB14464.1 PLxRFG domain-containing protein [Acinetobacter sp. ANC 5045]
MNIKQHFSTLVAQAAEQGKDASEIISQRDRLFNETIVPALAKKQANDVAIKQARTAWEKQTDQVMQSAGLIPKAGQSSASFAKDKRAERAIKKSAETGSKLPIIGETILSTAENIGNTFGQGVGSMIEGAAGFIRDIGENETDSIAARTAEYGKNLKKGYEESASTMQKEMQAGKHGKIPQLASGAVQSVPAMALPMGAARGAAVGVAKLGATAAAPYIGLGVGAVAGHTQNYGEVRRNATTNLERDFPTWQHLQGNPVYEAEFNKYLQSGMDINQAKVQAHKTALDLISENAADKYGAMMTGLDFIAPSGAVLGSGILKKAPTSKVGKILAGGEVSSELVKRQMAQAPRVGMAKLAPDLSLAANKAALGMVGKQALEEGLQGAIGEYGGQAASANIGGQSVQWGDVGKAFLEEAAIGGIMGGGMQSASRATPNDQAKTIATDLRNQTNRLRQEEAAARKELSEAIQLGDQNAINSATANLGNIATEAAKVKSAYEQYGVDVPYFVNRFAEQAAIQPTQRDQQEQVEQPTPEQQVQPAQPQQQQPTPQAQPKSVNMGMADTTNLVMDSVSKGKITPDEASEIQSNPILADVFRLSVTGDEVAAHNVVMNAVSLGNITPDQAQSMIQAIPRYKQLEKPSLSSIVNNHVQQQVQQSLQPQDDLFSGATELDPETFEPIQQEQSGVIPDDPNLTDFGYQPKQNDKPAPNDPNLRDFGIDVPEAIEPVAPVPNQAQPEEQAADFSQPKTFSNYIRANDFLKSNNLQDSHEIIKRGEGLITVQPKSIQSAAPQTPVAQQAEQNQAQIEPIQPTTPDEQASVNDFESDEAFDSLLNAVPPINTPKTTPEASQAKLVEPITPEPSKEFTFAEKIKDAHINNPKIKPQLINEEVAKGRPRSEVLKEVADIVKAANAGTPSSQPTITPVEQQPLQPKSEQAFQQTQQQAEQGIEAWKTATASSLPNPYSENELRVRARALNSVHKTPETFNDVVKRDFPNLYARGVELAKTATTTPTGRRGNTRLTELSFKGDDSYVSGDSWSKKPTPSEVLQQAIWHLSQQDQNNAPLAANQNQDQEPEQDIGRASDNAPFANESAANMALKKKGLESSHEVIKLQPSQFILRKKSAEGDSIKVEQPKQEAPKQTKDPAQQALDELRAIKAEDVDYSDIPKAIEHYRKERDANLKVADAINDPPSVKYYKENAEQAEKLAVELEKTLKNKTESKPKGRTLLGKNKYGHEVYEDERGVRSYLDPLGAFVSESVTITPNGFEYGSSRGIEYEVFDKNEAIKSALKDYHAAKDASLVDTKDVEGRKNHYERIVRAIDKLIDIDSSNASQWNDEKQKYVNSAQRYADILAKKTETQEQDNGSTKQLDERSEGTLEGTPTEDVPRVREQGDSAAEATGSSRDDIRGSVPTGTRGADSTRSMGDDSGEVSISTRGNDSNRGLNPKQAVVADNAPVDAFVIDENEIAKGGKKTKFKANIEAVKVIKTLEAENRPATKAEQKTLSKFVGWGGLPEAFRRADGSVSTGWAKEVAELESLLTEDEYDAAVDSSIAAHYTSPEIVHSMWKALEHFGFSQGRVLEPAVGVGNFFGLMPKNMRKASRLYAVELDNITGAIAKNLYPEASIKAPMGFQDYQTIDNYFDVAIGNPPFSSNKITDLVRPAINGFNLHNYFFAKSIDSVKPNGVLAMVVTNRFLDKIGDKERAYISDRAELVGAIRLPNDAFLSNAGTQVTTDIIFLRKRAEGEAITGESWLDVKNYKDKDGNTVPLNEYFVRHPENMLGDFGAYGSMYQDGEPALIKRDGQDTQALLNEAIERLPKDVFKAEQSQDFDEVRQTVVRDISAVKVGSRFIDADGEVYERLPDVMGEQQSNKVEFANEKARSRTIGMIQAAEKLSELRTLQLDKNATNRQIEASRKELNQIYDAFVKEHGFINNRTNALLMRDDPNWAQLSALEDKYDQGVSAAVAKSTGQKFRKPSAEKAAIFTKRTQVPVSLVESVSNAQDALTESLNRHGYVNTKTMQQLYGKTEDEIIAELGELIFNDPINGYVVRDEYLSGNVKQKLAIAKESAQKDPQYQRNVQALEKVIPEDIEALDIDVKIGSHWIPEKYIADFVSHITESPNAQAEYGKYSNKWEINPTGVSVLAQSNFSTSRADTKTILTHALNGTKPTIYDRFSDGTSQINQDATLEAGERVERVKNEWKEWLWQDDTRRETLERIYNDTFNTTVNRDFDGSHLVFYGMNSAIELRPHQKNAVWRSVQSKATLYDHTVGAGKTFTVVAAAMEMRRMGIVNKPLIVVPNHLVGQWAKDFVLLYPNANILAATKRDFEKANRKKFIAKIANGDYDAIIIAHSSFGKISISPEQEQAFIDNEIAELMAFEAELKAQKGGRSRNAKDIGKRRLALEEKKKNLLNRENKDTDNIYWHELGIDSIMLDEAHEFKNLEFTTAMQNVAGLGTGKGSQKAKDLFAKIQIMQQNNPKSKIIFATGTPISNTMAEMFTMQRYLDWDGLKRQGINHFDAWAKVFGEVVSDWELSPSGKYKLTNRFAKFVNMPELMQGYLGFSDVMNRDDINAQLAKEGKTLGTPKIKGDKPQNIVVERSDAQADYIGVATIDENGNEVYPEGSLVWRTENLPRKPEKGADNMLKIMGDARKAALDMRLIDPTAEDYEGSKVNVAANNIFETYKKWNAKKGTQLVFCDLSTPKGAVAKEKARIENLIKLADQGDEVAQAELDKLSPDELSALDSDFSVYDDLKAKLIAKGIKESEIAFIHDANTEEQKQKLFEAVKRGDIRVLMGSTAKMGAGMNVQNKLVALHHLDAPWRPSDLEQREGRIIRQGNEFYKADPNGFEIEINRYATKQTLDSCMWQTIESKAKFIEQVRKGTNVRAVEDIAGEAANAAEMKAASSGDPRILEEMELRKQVKDLEESKKNFDRDIHRTKNLIRTTELDIERNQRAIDRLLPDLEIKQPEKFVYSNDGKKINQEDKGAREEISKVFKTGIDSALAKGKEQSLGNINSFEIIAKPSSFAGIALIQLKGNAEAFNVDSFNIQDSSPVGLVQKILNHLKSLPLSLEAYKRSIDEAQKQLPNLRKKIENQKWERTDELNDLKQRHSDLLDELKPKKKETEAQQDEAPKMSRRASTGQGSTPEQVRSELVNRFGDDVISQLEQNGTLNIIPSYAEKGIEGFAENGKVTLVADAITADNIVPVFLHELGGHIGMQGVMKPQAYNNLMAEFNRLVKTGNPEALQAKKLAERESGAEVQADEYLPYLITVAAQAQQNANPAVRLVNRILSAVKAWAVDKLGLNLKLNPSDLVALAERMVKTVAKNPPPTPPKGRNKSLSSINTVDRPNQTETAAFKKWFGSSKVADANGKPIIMYHGTPKSFNQFNTNESGALLGRGSYFTAQVSDATAYAGGNKPMQTYLSIQNPYYVNSVMEQIPSRQKLKELGHDGVILLNEDKSIKWAVAHNPSQIKSATANNGTFDSNNPDIRYSRSSTANPQNMSRSKQREFLDTAAKTAFGGMALRRAEGAKTLSKRTLNLFQTMLHKSLADETGEFKKTFDLVQDKINHVTFTSAKSMDVAPSVLTQLETGADYVKEVKRVGRALGNTFTGGTLGKAKIDLDIEKVGNLMFENTLQDQSKRHSEAELKKLGFDDDQIGIYNEIRSAVDSSLDTFANTTFSNIYKHLGGTTEEVLELAARDLDIHEHYKEIMSRVIDMVKNDPKKAEAGKAAAEGINRVYNKANDLKAEGYVPLMRFGKYFIRVFNPTTGEVAYRQHYESESERNIEFDKQKLDEANLPAGYVLEKSQLNELEYKLFQGVSPETVALFAKESGLPIGDAEAAYIKHSLKNNHALKRLLKRQGIKGFDTDIKRVLASFVLSNSRYSANQTYNPAIDESITNISNPAYQEDAVRLRDYSLDTQEELAGVKNFAFVYYMGFSAMFGLVNLTQPFLQTLPYLMQYSKDYGITAKSLMKAIQTWRKGTNHIEPKYKAYYERARREGHLDPQNTWMLQGLERGKSGLGASTWQLISHSSGLFAQASETINRRTSLFAALDVAESLGQAKLEKLGFKDAYDFAVRTIQETQGIYNKGNRPRVARGNVGSILMMYKQFMIAYIEQMVRMQKSGLFGGEDDEFKKKMAGLVGFGISRSVLVALGILFSLSGTTGLPFVRDILDGIETAGGLMGKPVNTEREIQIALQDALGQTLGSTVNKALMDGFVNLQPVVDVKGRMGMGDLIPATAYFSPTTSQYQKSSEVAQIGGAIGGLIEKVRESVELAQVGSYGMAGVQLLPKAATSFGQGLVAATTGDYRNMKTGVKTNDATVLDGVIKMLDAQPAGIAEQGRIRGLEMRDRAVQQSINSRWKERYVQALESGDRKQVMEVKQEIRDYNRDNPRYPITFNQKTAETNFNKSNQSWQEKRKNTKGLEWMDDYNPHI